MANSQTKEAIQRFLEVLSKIDLLGDEAVLGDMTFYSVELIAYANAWQIEKEEDE